MSTQNTGAVTHCSIRRWGALLGLFVAGCVNAPPPPVPAPVPKPAVVAEPVPATPAPAPVVDWDLLDTFLVKGDDALKDDRLLTPIDDCAYDYYVEAQKVAPDHPAPREGLNRIVDRYVALASDAAQRGQRDRALNILERAKFINPDNPAIAMAQAQLELFGDAKRTRVTLDGGALSSRSAEVTAQLAALGVRAKEEGTWVHIVARNDEEGRWIYQQLRKAPGERRMRAELVLGAPPRIEFVSLAEAEEAP